MGVQLFAKIQFEDAFNEHANFQSFWVAMLTLLRFSTGENWNGFMHNVAAHKPNCVKDPQYDEDMCGFNNKPGCKELNGCGSSAIFIYLLSFTLIVTFVFLNLFIGVILEGFDDADEDEDQAKDLELYKLQISEEKVLITQKPLDDKMIKKLKKKNILEKDEMEKVFSPKAKRQNSASLLIKPERFEVQQRMSLIDLQKSIKAKKK